VTEICAYIPQAKLRGCPFPVILCDLHHIDTKFIGWTSPKGYPSYEFYNVVNDIPSLKGYGAFTIAKQWIPTPVSASSDPSSALQLNLNPTLTTIDSRFLSSNSLPSLLSYGSSSSLLLPLVQEQYPRRSFSQDSRSEREDVSIIESTSIHYNLSNCSESTCDE